MKSKKTNKFKKIYRICSKFLSFLIIKLLAPIIRKIGYNISPSLDKVNIFDYNYPIDTNRLVFNKNKKSFNKILIDLSLSNSKLCNLGKKFSTNKSPINLNGHRAGYTALYDILFAQMKDKKIVLAEIGIAKNSSMKMWRSFFSKAKIHGFEYHDELIKKAKKDKLIKQPTKEFDPSAEGMDSTKKLSDDDRANKRMGFFGYIFLIIIISFSLIGVLKTFEEDLIVYFPEQSYIFELLDQQLEFLAESVKNIIVIVQDLINSY